MLSPYRVLDLTSERGLLCGQILGDLGADVIKIEPPGGSPARRIGPYQADVPHPDRSLFWWAYNRNKRSITLDLDSAEGRAAMLRLVRSAHFLIESDSPGELARRGLGYADLSAVNPSLIYVSITPFGQHGPKALYADSDLVIMAAGGPLVLYGDDDRPPVRVSVPQAYLHAAAEAAVAALIAHHERVRSGLGQHVDIAAQQAVTAATQSNILAAAVGDAPMERLAGGARVGPFTIRFLFAAKDGYVSITHLFGSSIGPATRRLMAYIHDEGYCDAATRDKDWITYFEQLLTGAEPFEEYERVKQVVAEFVRTKTKAELFHAALERGLLIAPVATIDEVVQSPQLAARDYFRPLEHRELGHTVRYPGPFAKFSASPIIYHRRPPTVGEHTQEILRELAERGDERRATPARSAATDHVAEQPLAGLKVLDFMWAIAGPWATRTLADYGATVVRVESTTKLDVCRTLRPWNNGQLGPENSVLFHNTNAGKHMLTLDLAKPAGRAVALDLVRWADVVTEAFSPKAMRAWGLDYASLGRVKPDLIMLSTCLMGQTGPLAAFAGFGNLAAAVTGFYELCGWPDRAPAGPWGAYTDYIAPRFNAIAILAALEYRRRTGCGQHIDMSQAEASMHFLTPALLDYTVNGRVQSRQGNRDPAMAPHGVYPASGDDCWVAIAVTGDAQWRALCTAMERPDLAGVAQYASADSRLAHQEEIDALIAAWTRQHDMLATEAMLQAHGVAASAVQNSSALCRDPQLLQRAHFVPLTHADAGAVTIEGSRSSLSRTPARIAGAVPTFGRDNEFVLATLLGYSEDRITQLVVDGALE